MELNLPFFSWTLMGAVGKLQSPTPAELTGATRNSYSSPSYRSGTVNLVSSTGKSLTGSHSRPGFLCWILYPKIQVLTLPFLSSYTTASTTTTTTTTTTTFVVAITLCIIMTVIL